MDMAVHAHKELDDARIAFKAMESSKSLDDFEKHWKEYLHSLERIWSKSVAHFGLCSSWNGWKGRYESLRKKDPLLNYLTNARGAEEHTVAEITAREESSLSFKAGPTGSAVIKRITIMKDGTLSVFGDGSLVIAFSPGRIKLLPIVNRGRNYPIPSKHLGQSVLSDNVLEVAQAGINFYESFLADADEFFRDKKI
jgi:hypothetical protein